MTDEERKARKRESQRQYAAKYPERVAASQAKWRQKNPDYHAEWRQNNAERMSESQRAWRQANPEAVRESYRRWASKNKAKLSAKSVAYQKAHPEKVSQRSGRRRARIAGAPVNDLTAQDWRDILAEHGQACAYCGATGVPLEREHRVPLARGGSHTKANVVPACVPCNRRKSTLTDEEFRAR